MDSKFLAQQRTDLNASGSQKNMVYYDKNDVQMAEAEIFQQISKYKQSTNLSFGSTSQISIPNSGLLNEVMLTLTLPDTIANQGLCLGWGFKAIREISWSLGSQNISNITISGESLFDISMMSVSSEEKRNMILEVGGSHIDAVAVQPANFTNVATVIIPLPFSSYSNSSKPFDLSLLNDPISITISYNDWTHFYTGSVAPAQLQFSKAYVHSRMSHFQDRSMSIKNDLLNSSSIYQYPFQFYNSGPVKQNIPINAVRVTSKVDISSFLNADLVGIILSLKQDRLKFNSGASAPSTIANRIEDLTVSYNGEVMYSMEGNSSQLMTSLFDQGSASFTNQYYGQTTPWTANAEKHYLYYIGLGGFAKGVNFDGIFNNVPRFSSQVLQLEFTPQKIDVVNPDPDLNGSLYVTYIYNACANISGGVSSLQLS